jgi:hypothetical protein
MPSTPKLTSKPIDPTTLAALQAGTFDDQGNYRFAEQLPREVYADAAKVLTALGGKWSRKAKATEFPEAAREGLRAVLAAELMPANNPLDFYETPQHVVDLMIDMAEMQHVANHWILEPSAGRGAILKAMLEHAPLAMIDAIELDTDRARHLSHAFPTVNVMETNFLYFNTNQRYKRILMNPPYAEEKLSAGWAHHLLRAWDFLAYGGRLVAILPGHIEDNAITPSTSNHATRREAARIIARHYRRNVNLEPKTFQGTAVRTHVVCLQK